MLEGSFVLFLHTEQVADHAVGLGAVTGFLNTIIRKVN
jgi:hypothetical protein